jgi:transposase-like protein
VKRFKSLKPLLEMDRTKPTFEKVQEVADAVGKHPATIYRWLEAYERSERVSVFLRKGRSPAGSCARQISICGSLGTLVL